MADYLDFVAARQREGVEMSMLAVEEAFAAAEGFDAEQRRRLNFVARTCLEHEWAGPRSEVSLLEFDKTLGFAGHDRVFPDGYGQIIDRLAEGTPILLGREVRQIDYSGARVDVLTDQGSFQATHVLVTVPLGVLRAGRIGRQGRPDQGRPVAGGHLRVSSPHADCMRERAERSRSGGDAHRRPRA